MKTPLRLPCSTTPSRNCARLRQSARPGSCDCPKRNHEDTKTRKTFSVSCFRVFVAMPLTGALFDGDAKSCGMDAHPRPLPTLDRFPVHMKEQRPIGFDRGPLDVADRAARNSLDC